MTVQRRKRRLGNISRRVTAAAAAAGAALFFGLNTLNVAFTVPPATAQTITEALTPSEQETPIARPTVIAPQLPIARPSVTAPRFGGYCGKVGCG
jgi:cation transport regulator ChaC